MLKSCWTGGKFLALPVDADGYSSSGYEFNLDGLTNVVDLDMIRSQLQTQCRWMGEGSTRWTPPRSPTLS
jgi:hypothetical protein